MTRRVERAHEVEREVPPVRDPNGEERREGDDAVHPLCVAARVPGLVQKPMWVESRLVEAAGCT